MIHFYPHNQTTEKGDTGRQIMRFPVAVLAVLATLVALAVALATPLAALADTLTVSNTLVTNTDATKAPGDTGTANAWLEITNGTPANDINGCNVNVTNPGTVTFSSNNPNITFPNGNSAQLTDCGSANAKQVGYKVADNAQAGQAVIRATVTGGRSGSQYNVNDALTVTITAPAKQNTAVSLDPSSGTYGGSATLQATLKTAAGAALSGKTVDFTLNGNAVGSATTDASGVATKSVSLSGINAGTYTNYVSANFAGDTSNNGSTASGNLTVDKAQATLTLNGLGGHTYDGTAKAATATTNPADLGGVSITYDGQSSQPTNAGTYNVVASLDNPNYTSQNATGTMNIAKATPQITWSNPAAISYGTALGGTQLNASTDVDGSFSYTPASGTKLDAGANQDLKADFTPSNTGNYNGASKTVQINVDKADQAITFGVLADKTFGDADFNVSATADSGLGVGFASTTPNTCSVGNGTVSILGAGTCTIEASQGGNSNYNAAQSVTQSFEVSKATAQITLSDLNQAYDGGPKAATAATTPDGLNGVTITYSQNGNPVDSPTDAGSYDVVASLNNPNYTAQDATGTLVIDETAAAPIVGRAAGPVDPSNGFPFWYQDEGNTRLDLCLDPRDQMCLQPFEMPNPDVDEVSFPDNFPGEAFWWAGEASMTMNNGADAILVMAQEAAFANEDPRDGDQASFGRIRIRVDGLEPGQTYRVTHPYGVDEFVAEDDGRGAAEINTTEDVGCLLPSSKSPCQFAQNGHLDESLSSRVSTFLKWDEGAPEGYVGDPNVTHSVTGSPKGTNFFKVEKLADDGSVADELGQTDQFAISGKLATPQVDAAPYREVFNSAKDVTLVPSDPSYKVYYTTGEGDPATSGQRYSSPIHLDAVAGETNKTTLRFVAVDPATDKSSPVMEKTYTIDRQAPSLGADPAAGTYDVPQNVKLSTADAADKIYYTTDGSNPAFDETGNPTGSTRQYTDAIDVARSQTIKAIAVDGLANKSQVEAYRYTIASLAETGPINPQGGYPYWYKDASGVKLDLCLDPQDPMCLQPFESPDPTGPVSFPDNFPGEAFWWTGEADLGLPGSKKSLLVMAQEAAFANDVVKEGDQMSFGRIRIRIDGLQIGTKYRVTHPYGVDEFVAEDDGKGGGEINVTEDIGCFPSPGAPCDFDSARFGRVGPFLTWDTFGAGNDDPALRGPNGEPNAYVGDPNGEEGHKVKGSPVTDENGNPQNYFRLERLNNAGSVAEELGRTDLFAISGKVSKLQVGMSKQGGSYKAPQDVLLRASDKAATIYYTTDGSEPTTTSPNSFVGEGMVPQVGGATPTTLKFMAVDASGTQSQVYTETYEVDTAAPDAPAVPQLDEASDSGAKGDYMTNDTTPTLVGTAEAGSKVKVLSGINRVQVGSAAVDAAGNYSLTTSQLSNGERQLSVVVTDRATNESASTAFKVTIDTTAPALPTANPAPGTYAPGQTVSFTAEAGASIHYTTDTSVPTEQSTQYGDPITLNSSQTFNVIAVDRAGNASRETSFAYVINSANRPPTISGITPADGSRLRDRTPTITATVSDAETNLAAANISLRLDGNVANFAYNRTSDLLTFTPRQKLAVGRHTVRLVATDAQGVRTVEAWTFTITR